MLRRPGPRKCQLVSYLCHAVSSRLSLGLKCTIALPAFALKSVVETILKHV